MKQKILMIHHSGLYVGGSISFINTYKMLSNKYDIVVVIPKYPNDLEKEFKKINATVKTFNFKMGKNTYYSGGNNIINPKYWYHLLNIRKQKKYWEKLIIDEKPDLVVVNSLVLSWFSQITSKFGIKSICFVRETRKKSLNNIPNKIINKNLNNFSGVIFISKYDEEKTNLSEAKTKVVYNIITEVGLEKTNSIKDTSAFKMLYLGGLNKIKGIEDLLDSIIRIKSFKVELSIAGTNIDRLYNNKISLLHLPMYFFTKRINKKIAIAQERHDIVLHGLVKDTRSLYENSDVVVIPIKKVHQSRMIFESGYFDKAVIIPNFPEYDEFAIDKYNAYRYINNNSEDLKNKIEKSYYNKEHLFKMGINNNKMTKSHHTQDVNIKKLRNFIEKEIMGE